jgi:hypothetical protein
MKSNLQQSTAQSDGANYVVPPDPPENQQNGAILWIPNTHTLTEMVASVATDNERRRQTAEAQRHLLAAREIGIDPGRTQHPPRPRT